MDEITGYKWNCIYGYVTNKCKKAEDRTKIESKSL